MAITSYSETMTGALAGQREGLNHDVRSFTNQEAIADLPFGYAVVQGSGAKDALLPSTSDDVCVGIVAYGHSYGEDDLGDGGPLPLQSVDVINKGMVWVVVGEAVEVGDRGYVSYASGTATPGKIMKTDTTDATLDTASQIRFLTAQATPGGIALAEIDMMNEQGASSVTPSA